MDGLTYRFDDNTKLINRTCQFLKYGTMSSEWQGKRAGRQMESANLF